MGDKRRIPPTWTPIKDSSGKVVGYVDSTGRLVGDAKGNPVQSPIGAGMGGGSGTNTYPDPTTRKAEQIGVDPARAAERTAKVKAAEQKAADDAAAAARAKLEYVWVDGKRVHVNDDGTLVDPAGKDTGASVSFPSAFDALDGQSVDPKSPFLMNAFQWGAAPGQKTTLGNLFSQASQSGRSMMTVANGVQWLASLASKDSGAYQAMLEKLHSAGYLTDDDLAKAAGHWSAAAGQAFALAARDVAVVNTTPGGYNTTLDQFLASKQGALAASKEQSFTPVDRSYTDPDAIKATAKSAAQDLLGRRLTPEEEAQLVGHFRGLEDQMYNQLDAAHRANTGASVTQPNATGQIDDFLSSGPREQEGANWAAAQYGESLKQLFSQRVQLT